jgi:hypothetical protein
MSKVNAPRLTGQEWSVVVVLAFIPAVAEELTKVIWGWRLESGHRHLHCNVRTPAPAGGARGAVQV